MFQFLLLAASVVGVPVLGTVAFFYFYPQYGFRLFMRYQEHKVGMQIKYLKDKDYVYCYAEKNRPSKERVSLLFIHGFTGSKDQWIPCFKRLPDEYHILALDLPGHGNTSVPSTDDDLSFEFWTEKVQKFLVLLGYSQDRKVHVIGASFGGALAAVYASHYPQMVHKVSLICPAMSTPVESDFGRELKEAIERGSDQLTTDHCPLLPSDIAGYKNMMRLCVHNMKPFEGVHDKFWEAIIRLRLPRNAFYLRMLKSMGKADYYDIVEKCATKITAYTQLMWGEEDLIINVSGGNVLKSKLANFSRLDILPDCGHSVELDRPDKLSALLMEFARD